MKFLFDRGQCHFGRIEETSDVSVHFTDRHALFTTAQGIAAPSGGFITFIAVFFFAQDQRLV